MPQAVTRESRGTVFGQPLRLESDGMEELGMPGCLRIANRDEQPELSVLSIRTLAGFESERNAGVFRCKRRAASVFKGKCGLGLERTEDARRMNCRQPVQQYQVDDRWPSQSPP